MTYLTATQDVRAMRRAYNERILRANREIRAALGPLVEARPLPFLCECGLQNCSAIVRALPNQYSGLRNLSKYLLFAADHDEGVLGSHCVVARMEGAVVVEDSDATCLG